MSAVVFGLIGQPFAQAEPLGTTPSPLTGKVIVLDPGHAVKNDNDTIINPGAQARRGAYERDVALAVAEKMIPLLEAQGAKVYCTRTKDNPWRYGPSQPADNRSRAILANTLHADGYIRLHCDWNRNRHFQGYTVYYFHWGSRALAESIQHAFNQAFPTHRDNGVHRKAFVSVTAMMPTVLVEMGVLTYKEEAKELATDTFQQQLAETISGGIGNYFGKH